MERTANQTLLGIRFWDRLLQRHVADRLLVKAQRLSVDHSQRVGKAVAGRVTTDGTIAFFGLHSGERVEVDPNAQIWETVPPSVPVVVDMADVQRRYLPFSFVLDVPLDGPGAFKGKGATLSASFWRPARPDVEEQGVFLWTAPSRPAPDGFALLYAQIVVGVGTDPSPASHAVVEVRQEEPNTFSHFGIADGNGALMLPFPYPPPPEPDEDNYPALRDQTFPLRINVAYQPDHLTTLPGSEAPDLKKVLTQGAASIIKEIDEDGDPEAEDTLLTTLQYGKSLVLRTVNKSAGSAQTEPYLRIQ